MFIKKNWPYIFMLSCFLFVISLYFFRNFAMMETSETCGKVISEDIVKGSHSFNLTFYIGTNKQKSGVSSRAFKIKELEELKKYDCIKIKYSNSFPSYIEIVDKRLRAGSGW